MVRGMLIVLAVLAQPGAALQAQSSEAMSLAERRARAVTGLGEKYTELAAAVPAELHDWRPAEGVRSFREVFALIAAEFAWFPSAWGAFDDGGAASFADTMAAMEALEWDALVSALDDGARRTADAVRAFEGAPGDRIVSLGRRRLPARHALALLQLDMHEHLGQSIAYARVNGIVPPWSRDDR